MALKLGAEDKKKVYIASGLGVVVLGLAIYTFKDSFSSTPVPPHQRLSRSLQPALRPPQPGHPHRVKPQSWPALSLISTPLCIRN